MDLKYMPAIIIGCGGTGVRALRYIMAQGEHNKSLKEALESKRIQLIGIDSDRSSNSSPETLDPHTLKGLGERHHSSDNFPTKLPVLNEFVHIERQRISHALPGIMESMTKKGNNPGVTDENVEHSAVLDWFPPPQSGNSNYPGVQFHSEQGGATQNRNIGRLGFFLSTLEIYTAFRDAISHYDTINRLSPKRIYVLTSLAGGTGSGIFLDVAFLLKTINKDLLINGLFMLDGPFDNIYERRRIKSNVYASLQELVKFHNCDIETDYSVSYSIGGSKNVFNISPGDESVYKIIYIYQDFKPGEGAADPLLAKFETSCFRMATNCITMIREDIHNLSDTNKNHIDNNKKLFFSTTNVAEFHPPKLEDLENHFTHMWISEALKEANVKKVDGIHLNRKELIVCLLDGIVDAPGSGSYLNLSEVDSNNDDHVDDVNFDMELKTLFNLYFKVNENNLSPKSLLIFIGELEENEKNSRLALKDDDINLVKTTFFNTLPKTLWDGWDVKEKPFQKNTVRRTSIKIDLDGDYEDFVNHILKFINNIKELNQKIVESKRVLSCNSLRLIEKLKSFLIDIKVDKNNNSENYYFINIEMPGAFSQICEEEEMGIDFGFFEGVRNRLFSTFSGYKNDKLHSLMRNIEIAHQKIKKQILIDDDKRDSLLKELICKFYDLIVNSIDDLIESNQNNHDVNDLSLQIQTWVSKYSHHSNYFDEKNKSNLNDGSAKLLMNSFQNNMFDFDYMNLINATELAQDDFSDKECIKYKLLDVIKNNIKKMTIQHKEGKDKTELKKVILNVLPDLTQITKLIKSESNSQMEFEKIVDDVIEVICIFVNKLYTHYSEELNIIGGFDDYSSDFSIKIINSSSSIFSKGGVDTSRSLSKLYYISDNPDIHNFEHDNIRTKLKVESQKIYNLKLDFINSKSNVPTLYYENYFRSVEEISNIKELENAYNDMYKQGYHNHFDSRINEYENLSGTLKKS